MSYIRCLSNPEGLYIWNDGKNVSITHSVKYPQSSRVSFPPVPQKYFDAALAKWHKNPFGPINYRGIEIKEEHVYSKSFRPVRGEPKWWLRKTAPTQFMIRLSYKNAYIYMWRVTMEYIANRG